MKLLLKLLTTGVVFAAVTAAQATTIKYEGDLALPDSSVVGSVGGFGYVREVADQVDFWSFTAQAGDLITIRGTRIDAALDPTMDVLFGLTSADDSLFRTGKSWADLQFIGTSDDVVEPPAGPFGDPVLTFLAPSSGSYTLVIGGSGSDGEGPYSYNLSMSAVQAVPEPSSLLLMMAGLGCVAGVVRRRQPRRRLTAA
jgi:hypothetical protein